jgi:plastocyanin
MDGNFFFVMGVVLVGAAVTLAFVGIRGSDSFPANRAMLVGVTALFAAIVGVTVAFAVVKSVDEQDERNEELAKEEQEAEGEAEAEAPPATPGGQPQASGGGNQQAPVTTATSLDVGSPDDGSLVFEPNGLQAQPGSIDITYSNPSQVAHSIAVATANGNVLGETEIFAAGEESLDLADVAPGKYVFYCTVPGHREGGMEGDLTVSGGATP